MGGPSRKGEGADSQSPLILTFSPEGAKGLRFEVLFFDIGTNRVLGNEVASGTCCEAARVLVEGRGALDCARLRTARGLIGAVEHYRPTEIRPNQAKSR